MTQKPNLINVAEAERFFDSLRAVFCRLADEVGDDSQDYRTDEMGQKALLTY